MNETIQEVSVRVVLGSSLLLSGSRSHEIGQISLMRKGDGVGLKIPSRRPSDPLTEV